MTKNNLTQNELSKKIGKTLNTVNNYLTGKTKIDIETFIRIAEVLGVPVGYFFEGGTATNKETKELLEILKKYSNSDNFYIKGSYDFLKGASTSFDAEDIFADYSKRIFNELEKYRLLSTNELKLLLKKQYINEISYLIIKKYIQRHKDRNIEKYLEDYDIEHHL